MIYRLLGKLMYDSPDIRDRVSNRIYFEYAPELKSIPEANRGPCIIIRNFSGQAETHLQNECNCAQPMVQIDCYDTTATKARSLYELVRLRLSGYGATTVEDVLDDDGDEVDIHVSAIILRRPGMYVEEPRDGSDKWSHRYTADFEVFHSQTVPTHV